MLFHDSEKTSDVAATFQMLPPFSIVLGANMRRTVLAEELTDLQESVQSLRELGEGIQGSGILQALLVRPIVSSCNGANGVASESSPDTSKSESQPQYQLVCGQKRLLAAKALGLDAIPCLIDHRDLVKLAEDPDRSLEGLTRLLQLTENSQRSEAPPLEEAEALMMMMKELRLSVRSAARLLGKNKGYVENRLRLLKMVPDVQRMVSLRKDTMPHAYYISQVTDEELRSKLITAVVHEQIGVREVRRRIEESNEQIAAESASEDSISTETNNAYVGGRDNSKHDDRQIETMSVSLNGSVQGALNGSTNELAQVLAPRRDYLRQNLRPAVSLVAQAVSDINAQQMTETQRKNIYVELSLLRRQIEALEDRLGSLTFDTNAKMKK